MFIAVAGSVLAASCADDGDNTASKPGTSPVVTTTPATPSPVTTTPTDTRAFKVMVIGDFTYPAGTGITTPEALPSAEAALRSLPNVEVLGCDSKGDPNDAGACQREAVSKDVAAVIIAGGRSTLDMSVLTAAGLPVLGQPDATKDNAFGLGSSNGQYVGLGAGVVKQGCMKVGVLHLDPAAFLADAIKKGAEFAGGAEVARAGVPVNAPDLAPAVSKVLDGGATCIALIMSPNMIVQAITAINQSGKKPLIAAPGAILTKEVRAGLGPLADNVLISEIMLNPDDEANQSDFDDMRADLDAVDKSASITQPGIGSWASGKLIAAALEDLDGEVTKESLMTALNGLKDVDLGGILHAFSAIPLTNPAYKRWFNHYSINYLLNAGQLERSGNFIDLSPVLNQQ